MDSFNQVVSQNIGLLVAVLGALVLGSLSIGLLVLRRIGTMSRRFAWSTSADSNTDTLPALLSSVESSLRRIGDLEAALKALASETRTHFKHVGLVRYDAFEGVAGQQSYSLCLLDDRRNGVLITNLIGSNFNRGYAVEIHGGEASRKLGDEERQAVTTATGDRGATAVAPEAVLTSG